MKLIGFVKEYNNIKEATYLDSFLDPEPFIRNNTEQVINYLNNGILLFAWMGYFIDVKTKELIAPDSYLTDGVWVWLSYFPYYLKRHPSMKIDDEFIQFMEAKHFQLEIPTDFPMFRNNYEMELLKKLDSRYV